MGAPIHSETGIRPGFNETTPTGETAPAFSAQREIAALASEPTEFQKKQLGPGLWAELQSLAKENDPELFYAGALHLGRRLQDRDRTDFALRLYELAARQNVCPKTARRAETAIAALEGSGAIGARAEVLLSRFSKDATDPAMILPMLAGASLGGLARGAGLGRLATHEAAWYSRGLGARLTAGSLGYAVEVPAFVATGRVLRSAADQPQAGWGHDFATGALSLGAIKAAGLLGKQGLAQFHGVNEWGMVTRGAALAKYSHPLVAQSSLFGGLMAAHWTETKLGLRPQVDGATSVTDTLAAMLSLGVGMRLGQGLLGRGYAAKMRELEWRTQSSLRALPLPTLEMPTLSARATSAATGLGLLLHSPLAQASEGGRWNSTSLTATILSSLALGGLIGWGVYRARRAYVAPQGPILRLRELQESISTMLPARLAKEVGRAQALLQASAAGDRKGDGEAVETASAFLENALPKLNPSTRTEVFFAWLDLILSGKEDFSAPTLAIFKRTLSLLPAAGRRDLLDRVHQGTQHGRPDKALTAFFLLSAVASSLPFAERQAVYDKAMLSLEQQRDNLDNNSKLLLRQRVLLRELRDFLDQEHQEYQRGLRDELYELEKNPDGGWVPGFREVRIASLRKALESVEERPAEELLAKFRKDSEDPLARNFDLQDALVQAHKLVELFEENGGYRAPNFDAEFSLRAHLNEAGLKAYLRDGHHYIVNVTSESIRAMLTVNLTGIRAETLDAE